MATKFDSAKANEAKKWIEDVVGESFPSNNFGESLKSGVLLCKLLNKLQSGTVTRINTQNMAFKQMENIAAYIEGSKKLGVPDQYNFMTVDLFEEKNLGQVVLNILTLKKERGFGFKSSNSSSSGLDSSYVSSRDQSTEAKSQEEFISRTPLVIQSENEVSRTGPAKLSGRLVNETAFKCSVCTLPITSGAVNALGKAWHPHCFNCKKCGIKLAIAKYYEHDSQPYCQRCILIVKPQTTVKGATSDLSQEKGFKFQ